MKQADPLRAWYINADGETRELGVVVHDPAMREAILKKFPDCSISVEVRANQCNCGDFNPWAIFADEEEDQKEKNDV